MDTDFCYFPECTEHHKHTPPPNPNPTYEQQARWHNQMRRRYMLDRNPTQDGKQMWAHYMQTVDGDTEATLWGWQYAEWIGLAWFDSTINDWKLR